MTRPSDMGRRAADGISQDASRKLADALTAGLDSEKRITTTKRGRVFFAPPVRVAVFGTGPGAERLCGALKRLGFQPLMLPSSYTLTDTWHATFSRYAQVCFVDVDAIAQDCDAADFLATLRTHHTDMPMVAMVAGDAGDALCPPADSSLSADFTGDALAMAISGAMSNLMVRRLRAGIAGG